MPVVALFVVALLAGVAVENAHSPPGADDPRVTQANIGKTICVPGYTRTVRPPSAYTRALKIAQLGDGEDPRGYEEDHMVPLELGGAPYDPKNLWPESYAGDMGARVKDRLENRLHALVCAHEVTLADARRAIAHDWMSAYERYVGEVRVPREISLINQ